ncbi:MAG TPA: hypothetical protein VLZ76_03900 [Lysobacter sp.]|nr:hypothetical protein [Lysobacter sp.]
MYREIRFQAVESVVSAHPEANTKECINQKPGGGGVGKIPGELLQLIEIHA